MDSEAHAHWAKSYVVLQLTARLSLNNFKKIARHLI